VPRSGQSTPALAADRDPVARLSGQNASRLPDLVPIRNGRLLRSPFAFFRGAAAVMADDLASAPSSGLRAQLSGDAHLLNFGGFASPERDLVFDLNDFDETSGGPFEWDVKRLATSLEIAGRDRDFNPRDRAAAVLEAVRSYRTAMRQFAGRGNLDVWYARLDAQAVLDELRQANDPKRVRLFRRAVARARRNDGRRALSSLTTRVDGQLRIRSEPPLMVPLRELDITDAEEVLRGLLAGYRKSLQPDRRSVLDQFHYVDFARKVVGVGSVGTRCWIVLLLGRNDRDPLFLQLKEAGPSVLERSPRAARSSGRRVVEGQRLLQAASDIFLGWTRVERDLDGGPREYYVRQLRDWKMSVDMETISPRGLVDYARFCGWTLARGHARSGDRVAIAAYLGPGDRFDRAVADYAGGYADVNERDHAAFAAAISRGQLSAIEDV
jgi:uncharacterized protein (DUF2252 family)